MSSPRFPLFLCWTCAPDVVDQEYDSLEHAAQDLQFVSESGCGAHERDEAVFTDSNGTRFRILVISLRAVLCEPVPRSFDSRELRLLRVPHDGEPLDVEFYGTRPHRGLRVGGDTVVPAEVLSRLSQQVPSWASAAWAASPRRWSDFDEEWFRLVDPAPPIFEMGS